MNNVENQEEVNAFQYDGDFIDRNGTPYVPRWALDALNKGIMYYKDAGDLYIKKQDNNYPVYVDDYIIKDTDGELHLYRKNGEKGEINYEYI